MSAEARAAILARVRGALGRTALRRDARELLLQRVTKRQRGTVPRRGQGDLAHRIAVFTAEAQLVQSQVRRVPSLAEVPAAVAALLAEAGLPPALRAGTDALVAAAPWDRTPSLMLQTGPARAGDSASVTGAFAGIAETGTLMLFSAPERPTSLNFLPELHIVLLDAAQIVPCYEDAFDMLRAERRGRNTGLPRAINLISGPSRTADVEGMLTLGAHGPRQLHIVLIDSA